MKTVVIGAASSLLFREHIIEVCCKFFTEVIILSTTEKDTTFFDELDIQVYFTGLYEEEIHYSKDRRDEILKKRWDTICEQINDIDVLQVHYCCFGTRMYCYKKLSAKSKKNIMVYWGSDMFRADIKNLEFNREAIKCSHHVICLTQNLKQAVEMYYGDIVNRKIQVIDFGVKYEDIKRYSFSKSKKECKRLLGFPEDKISIMVGYNGSEGQQHVLSIDAINKLTKAMKDRIFLFLPMTYGTDDTYLERVEDALRKTQIQYKIYNKFLDRENIILMRLSTDIFVHAQITDALSNSLCECVYAGAEIINPKWIYYPEFIERGVYFHEYENFENLKDVLSEVITNYGDNNKNIKLNQKILWDLNEREKMIFRWKKLLIG